MGVEIHGQSRILDEVEGVSFGSVRGSETGSSFVDEFGGSGPNGIFAAEDVFVDLLVVNLQGNWLIIMIDALGVDDAVRQLSDGLHEAMVFQFLEIANVGHLSCLIILIIIWDYY